MNIKDNADINSKHKDIQKNYETNGLGSKVQFQGRWRRKLWKWYMMAKTGVVGDDGGSSSIVGLKTGVVGDDKERVGKKK